LFRRDLLSTIRPNPASSRGLEYLEGVEEDGHITSGLTLDPTTGKTYPIKNGYLDLLGRRSGADNRQRRRHRHLPLHARGGRASGEA
jgi:hypothetical protein